MSGLEILFPETTKERWTASLDRKDSRKGYIKGNVQWLHSDINLMKQGIEQEKFIDMCRLISNRSRIDTDMSGALT